jgi:hypothetical protein
MVGVAGLGIAPAGMYQAPLIPMALLLGAGALLWLSIDPSRKLFPPHKPEPALIT